MGIGLLEQTAGSGHEVRTKLDMVRLVSVGGIHVGGIVTIGEESGSGCLRVYTRCKYIRSCGKETATAVG